MSELLLAHAGQVHWYDYLLWLGPVVTIGLTLLIGRWRLKRLEESGGEPDEPEAAD